MMSPVIDDDLSYLASSGRTPDKSYYMLSHCDSDIVSWNESGESIVIKDVRRFEDETLPSFFPRQREGLPSFIRSLNAWGFQKAKRTAYHSEYSHHLFRRGHPELLRRMKRGSTKKQAQAAAATAAANAVHQPPLQSLPSRESGAPTFVSGSLGGGDASDTENVTVDGDTLSASGGSGGGVNMETTEMKVDGTTPLSETCSDNGVSSALSSRCPTPTSATATATVAAATQEAEPIPIPMPTPLGCIVQCRSSSPQSPMPVATTATTQQQQHDVATQALQNQVRSVSQSINEIRQETSSQLQLLKNDMETRMRRIENLLEMVITTSLATQSMAAVAPTTTTTPQQQQQQQQRSTTTRMTPAAPPHLPNMDVDTLSFLNAPDDEEDGSNEITAADAHFLAAVF